MKMALRLKTTLSVLTVILVFTLFFLRMENSSLQNSIIGKARANSLVAEAPQTQPLSEHVRNTHGQNGKQGDRDTELKSIHEVEQTRLVFFWTGWAMARHIFEGPMMTDYPGFTKKNCRKTCTVQLQHASESHANASLVVFYYGGMPRTPPKKFNNQVWMFRTGEPQVLRSESNLDYPSYANMLNYTQSFKVSSTHGIHFGQIFKRDEEAEHKNWAEEKRKIDGRDHIEPSILWLVNNCDQAKSGREAYVRELAKHIDISIYSNNPKCHEKFPGVKRNGPVRGSTDEFKGFTFYLAFENSRCADYITEKFWKIILTDQLVIPIVLGGGANSQKEYEVIAPPNSYINVLNFTSPADLATHIRTIVRDDSLFNYYHSWRHSWRAQSGERVEDDAAKLCEMCELAHEQPQSVIPSFLEYYSPRQCLNILGHECETYNLNCT